MCVVGTLSPDSTPLSDEHKKGKHKMTIQTAPISHPTLKVVQAGRSQSEIVRPASREATAKEVSAAMCSCVVHLCGCE